MGALKLKAFRCVEESDEAGWDSPYFVVFHGDSHQPDEATVTTVRRNSWDNEIESGSLVQPNALVAKDVDTSTFVLVALMEEDVNADIVGAQADKVEKWMRTFFEAYAASGSNTNANIAKELIPEFRRALDLYGTNDEILGVKHLPITKQAGDLKLLWFMGDGARYKVRFAMAAD